MLLQSVTTSLVADLLLGGTPLTYDLSFILVGRARFIAYFVVVLLTNIIMTRKYHICLETARRDTYSTPVS